MLNRHGQPKSTGLNAKLRSGRGIDELIGLCKGLIGDGLLNQAEAEFLRSWLVSNREIANQWPANILYERIDRAFEDGHMDENEEGELLALLMKVAGGNAGEIGESSYSTSLPIDEPQPQISVPGHSFCFTGKFLLGTRDYCARQVVTRGGGVLNSIVQDLDFLVIGVVGSRDWKHSTHGAKILKAVEYRDKGIPIKIVNEQHFSDQLGLVAP